MMRFLEMLCSGQLDLLVLLVVFLAGCAVLIYGNRKVTR